MRSVAELDSVIEENAALVGKKELLQLYHEATEEPYNFLYINAAAKDISDVYWLRFERALATELF